MFWTWSVNYTVLSFEIIFSQIILPITFQRKESDIRKEPFLTHYDN